MADVPIDLADLFSFGSAASAGESAWEAARKMLGSVGSSSSNDAVSESAAMRDRIAQELGLTEENLSQALHMYSEMVNPGMFSRLAAGTAEGMMQSAYAGNRVVGAAMARSLGADEQTVQKKISLQAQLENLATAKIDRLRRKIELENLPKQQELQQENLLGLREQREANAEYRRQGAQLAKIRGEVAVIDANTRNKLADAEISVRDAHAGAYQSQQELNLARAAEALAKAQHAPEYQAARIKSMQTLDRYREQLMRQSDATIGEINARHKTIIEGSSGISRKASSEQQKALGSFASKYNSGKTARLKQATSIRSRIADLNDEINTTKADKKKTEDQKRDEVDGYTEELGILQEQLKGISDRDRAEDLLYWQWLSQFGVERDQPGEQPPPISSQYYDNIPGGAGTMFGSVPMAPGRVMTSPTAPVVTPADDNDDNDPLGLF